MMSAVHGPYDPASPVQYYPTGAAALVSPSLYIEYIPNRVFIGGLHSSTTEQELRSHFEQFCEIKEIKVIRAAPNGNSKGYGFITCETEEEANFIRALTEEKLDFKGRKLNVGPAIRRVSGPRTPEYAIATTNGQLVPSPTYGYAYTYPQQPPYVMYPQGGYMNSNSPNANGYAPMYPVANSAVPVVSSRNTSGSKSLGSAGDSSSCDMVEAPPVQQEVVHVGQQHQMVSASSSPVYSYPCYVQPAQPQTPVKLGLDSGTKLKMNHGPMVTPVMMNQQNCGGGSNGPMSGTYYGQVDSSNMPMSNGNYVMQPMYYPPASAGGDYQYPMGMTNAQYPCATYNNNNYIAPGPGVTMMPAGNPTPPGHSSMPMAAVEEHQMNSAHLSATPQTPKPAGTGHVNGGGGGTSGNYHPVAMAHRGNDRPNSSNVYLERRDTGQPFKSNLYARSSQSPQNSSHAKGNTGNGESPRGNQGRGGSVASRGGGRAASTNLEARLQQSLNIEN